MILVEVHRDSVTRSDGLQLGGKTFQSVLVKYFSRNRVTELWHKLPTDEVNARTMDSFKNRLEQ